MITMHYGAKTKLENVESKIVGVNQIEMTLTYSDKKSITVRFPVSTKPIIKHEIAPMIELPYRTASFGEFLKNTNVISMTE